VAVFVDAGYVFAAGATAAFGAVRPRPQLKLDVPALYNELLHVSAVRAEANRLLRMYWYDGLPSTGYADSHRDVAAHDYMLLRLSPLDSRNRQSGVDILLAEDLVQLTANRAICDAVLMTGDVDMLIGVRAAQRMGTRVHLVGIAPVEDNQHESLTAEVDTRTVFNAKLVQGFLSLVNGDVQEDREAASVAPDRAAKISDIVNQFVLQHVLPGSLPQITKYTGSSPQNVTNPHDSLLLYQCSLDLGELARPEKILMRQEFHRVVCARDLAAPNGQSLPTGATY
jgi:uncharacterized LabA/DUF88 family protein